MTDDQTEMATDIICSVSVVLFTGNNHCHTLHVYHSQSPTLTRIYLQQLELIGVPPRRESECARKNLDTCRESS